MRAGKKKPQILVDLQGQIERVTYTNDDNGYTIAKLKVYGIEKYLGSGLIKGIGPVMANRIVKVFGKETIEVIEKDTEKLSEVQGTGKGLSQNNMIKLMANLA